MFTGLIQSIGTISLYQLNAEGSFLYLEIDCPLSFEENPFQKGDSIAVDGVCLTIVELKRNQQLTLGFEVSRASLENTIMSKYQLQQQVNLEAALMAKSFLGGHWVSGHVDTTALIETIEAHNQDFRLTFIVPENLRAYVVMKGSITINGVSLTVNDYQSSTGLCELNIIPHTREVTNLGYLQIGHSVNVEVDMLAKYLEKQIAPYLASIQS